MLIQSHGGTVLVPPWDRIAILAILALHVPLRGFPGRSGF